MHRIFRMVKNQNRVSRSWKMRKQDKSIWHLSPRTPNHQTTLGSLLGGYEIDGLATQWVPDRDGKELLWLVTPPPSGTTNEETWGWKGISLCFGRERVCVILLYSHQLGGQESPIYYRAWLVY